MDRQPLLGSGLCPHEGERIIQLLLPRLGRERKEQHIIRDRRSKPRERIKNQDEGGKKFLSGVTFQRGGGSKEKSLGMEEPKFKNVTFF